MEEEAFAYIPIHKRVEAEVRMGLRFESGETVTGIAADLDISRQHLYRLEDKYYNDPSMADKERSGRLSKVDPYMEERILREVKKDPFESYTHIAEGINMGMEVENQISSRT